MSRIARVHKPLLSASLTAGIVLTTVLVTGVSGAQAATAVTDLEGTALRISGSAIAPGATIPAGRTLTPVRLTTADPETSETDGLYLSPAVPEVRIKRKLVFPAVPAEQATLAIDGVTVATTVPDFRGANLETDQGTVTARLFTVGGVTYAVPRNSTPVNGASRIVARSATGTSVSSLEVLQHGLLPVGAVPRVGSILRVVSYGATISDSQTRVTTIYDADEIRGNADSFSEELGFSNDATEVLAIVRLGNGDLVEVRGLLDEIPFKYLEVTRSWAFDRAALAAAGATVADVTGVVSSVPSSHDLTWTDLGFDPA